jgi:hypothetical protein
MRKRMTITLDEAVCDGLCRIIGKRRISRFIEYLVRPQVASGFFRASGSGGSVRLDAGREPARGVRG